MSVKDGAALGVIFLVALALIVWTLFGYGVMIAAFVALEGMLKVLMGVYIVGSLIIFGFTLFVRAVAKR